MIKTHLKNPLAAAGMAFVLVPVVILKNLAMCAAMLVAWPILVVAALFKPNLICITHPEGKHWIGSFL